MIQDRASKRMPVGTGSFVTRGRGNAQSWSSSSHGAGRKMSRTKAKANITQVSVHVLLINELQLPACAAKVCMLLQVELCGD